MKKPVVVIRFVCPKCKESYDLQFDSIQLKKMRKTVKRK